MKKIKSLKTLGGRIRHLRGDKTQTEFANIFRIKQAMISRYEADLEMPSPQTLLRIAKATGMSIELLLTGEKVIDLGVPIDMEATKPSRKMSRDKLVKMAARNLNAALRPNGAEFSAMMLNCFSNRKLMRKVLDYFRYLEYKEKHTTKK